MEIMSVKFEVLLKFFKDHKYSKEEIELNAWTKIVNQEKFVDSHLSALKANSGNKTLRPYYDRLVEYYLIIKKSAITL